MGTQVTRAFQPVFRNVNWGLSSTINTKIDSGKNLVETFHYHPQVELIALRNCRGSAMVGTNVCALEQDEILLIGKNTPHGFFYDHNDKDRQDKNPAHALVIQFDECFMGRDFFSIPEAYSVKRILTVARQGLLIKAEKRTAVANMMERVMTERGLQKMLLLLEILHMIQERDENYFLFRNMETALDHTDQNDARLQQIWKFTSAHYQEAIRIEEVASTVNLTKESFCRFFKLKTNMTYMEYLFSVRIEKAKAMILENKYSIKEVGYACGFLSLSNFYYQFKKITHCSPLEYQNELFQRLNN